VLWQISELVESFSFNWIILIQRRVSVSCSKRQKLSEVIWRVFNVNLSKAWVKKPWNNQQIQWCLFARNLEYFDDMWEALLAIHPVSVGKQSCLLLKCWFQEDVCLSVKPLRGVCEEKILEMALEKFNSIHPSKEVYRMKITATVQPIYYDFWVTNQMEVFYIESPCQVKGGPDTQQFCSCVGARATVECPFVGEIFWSGPLHHTEHHYVGMHNQTILW
jgi:hypothetical protein